MGGLWPWGREVELDAVAAWLRGRHPLLSVTGPLGVGKCTVVREALRREGQQALFVNALEDPASVEQTLERGTPSAMVVLEHSVLDWGVVRSWARTPRWAGRRWIVASREISGIGEVITVPPLPVGGDGGPDAPAVQCLVSAAARIGVSLELGPSLLELLGQTDGLPLAIELVAERLRLFGPAALAGRLATDLSLFAVTGGLDRPKHQRSLRAAFELSWDRLDASERRLLCTLARAGGVSLADVERAEDERDLSILERLVRASLIHRSGERFVALPLLRRLILERGA